MPLHMHPGCSHRPDRDERGQFHHITTSTGETFVAREMKGEWWGWDDADAMNAQIDGLRPGEHRVLCVTLTLTAMIENLDRISQPAEAA